MAESTKIKDVLIVTLGDDVQEIIIATQLLLRQQKSLEVVVVLFSNTIKETFGVIEQAFHEHQRWPHLDPRPIPVDIMLEPSQFDLFANILYTEIKYWLDSEHRIHLLLANGCRAMTMLGMSVAQLLLGVEDHIWHLHIDRMLRKSSQTLLSSGKEAQLIEIPFPRLMQIPIYFTSIIQAESMYEACSKLAEVQQRDVRRLIDDKLTPTEHNIAALIAMGISNSEIANRLQIEEKTLKNHTTHIYRKLEEMFPKETKPQLKRKFLQTKLRKWLSP